MTPTFSPLSNVPASQPVSAFASSPGSSGRAAMAPRDFANRSIRPTVRIAGKVGEIAQGVDEGGAWLVSGAVTAGPFEGRAWAEPGVSFRLTSRDGSPKPKAEAAVREFLRLHGVDLEAAGHIHLETITLVGKGLGSSSVDSSLAIAVGARANGLVAHPREMYSVLCSIERSDPVWLCDELVFARPEAGMYEVWGPQPHFILIAWDTTPGAMVDTADAANLDVHRRDHMAEYGEILAMIRTGDPGLILGAATRSAALNDRYLPKPGFSWARGLAESVGGGLICCHSGTYLGVLLPPDSSPGLIGRVRSGVLEHGVQPDFFLMGGPNE